MAYRFFRSAWRCIPLDIRARQNLRERLFRLLPWLFSKHPAFPARKTASELRGGVENPPGSGKHSPEEYVRLLEAEPLASLPVQLIAFYLPQFYPIPENDEWWGRGFTEWANVVRGKPRFKGHYQPRLPGELGFYDLRIPEIQQRQVELAELYGISGFAYYFYWFGGKRLLERPLQQYLRRTDLHLSFCLCWANENWTRRWDGRNKELLISQQHSPEDDIAFIEYVSSYLRDKRYIRIRGRPLLIVYRPDTLPSPTDTAARWREWCRRHGIGDIFLAYTQSFETIDPQRYGFDAAIEFPPNNSHAPVITDQVEQLDPHFCGQIYDWEALAARSQSYKPQEYKLFRCVNPSWDNEARRPNCGAVYFGATPDKYRSWLANAVRDTRTNFDERSERLVFINAWNEWAEGAYLEPDREYGYANLQATRDALTAFTDQARRF
jgi:lipopolysaccharide biosynthesis protein